MGRGDAARPRHHLVVGTNATRRTCRPPACLPYLGDDWVHPGHGRAPRCVGPGARRACCGRRRRGGSCPAPGRWARPAAQRVGVADDVADVEQGNVPQPAHRAAPLVRLQHPRAEHRLVQPLPGHPLGVPALLLVDGDVRGDVQAALSRVQRDHELQSLRFVADQPDRVPRQVQPRGDADEPGQRSWPVAGRCATQCSPGAAGRRRGTCGGAAVRSFGVGVRRNGAGWRVRRPERQGGGHAGWLADAALTI